jgi:hypothetical protein
VRCGPRGIVNL